MNGSLIERNSPPDLDVTPGTTRDIDGNLVYTLTVIARVEYNGTVVVCVARFDDGTPDINSSRALLIGNT